MWVIAITCFPRHIQAKKKKNKERKKEKRMSGGTGKLAKRG